jgi:Ni/Co efflux regulator RcnB
VLLGPIPEDKEERFAMKKLVALLFALALTCSLAAAQDKDDKGEKKEKHKKEMKEKKEKKEKKEHKKHEKKDKDDKH